MRPLTHDDPNAIPRNGTAVPWPELPAELLEWPSDGAPGKREKRVPGAPVSRSAPPSEAAIARTGR